MSSETNYQFLNSKPGHYRSRGGNNGNDNRTKIEWEQALEGHIRNAHDSVFSEKCAACRELRKKAKA